jgi:hypothetical protein
MKTVPYLTAILLSLALTTPALSASLPTPPSLQGVVDRLPKITFVKQKFGRSVVVLQVNCPVEVLTGITIPPIELARQALDKTATTLNEKEIFKYDIQFVCG